MPTTSSTLLIWEQVPESTTLYVIPDSKIVPQMREWLRAAHNKFINADEENDGMTFLNVALCENKSDVPEDSRFYPFVGIFVPYKLGPDPFESDGSGPTKFDKILSVYVSGFVL